MEEGVVPFDNVVSIFTGFNLQLLSHTFGHYIKPYVSNSTLFAGQLCTLKRLGNVAWQ